MYETTDQEWRRVVIRGSVVGFVGSFLVVFAICLVVGVSGLDAAGCAVIPAVQGSWFYGGTVYLLRADHDDERRRKAAKAAGAAVAQRATAATSRPADAPMAAAA